VPSHGGGNAGGDKPAPTEHRGNTGRTGGGNGIPAGVECSMRRDFFAGPAWKEGGGS